MEYPEHEAKCLRFPGKEMEDIQYGSALEKHQRKPKEGGDFAKIYLKGGLPTFSTNLF